MSRLALIAPFVSAALVLAFVSALTLVSATHSTDLIGLLAIDANVQGNTATAIGPIDGCARVEPGGQIDVDYVVDAIPEDRPIIAIEVDIRYNPVLLEVVGVRYDLMLAAVGAHQLYGGGDPIPDTDDSYHLIVLDTASQTGIPEINQAEANVERGKGVLARITFRGRAPGVSEVTVGYDPPQGPYPLTQDSWNETIIVDKIGGASVAIGQDCPPAAIAPHFIDPPNTEEEIFAGVPAPVVAAPEPNSEQSRAVASAGGEPTGDAANSVPSDAGVTANVDDPTDAEDIRDLKDATRKAFSAPQRNAAGPDQDSRPPDRDGNGDRFIAWVLGGFAVAVALAFSGGIIFLVIRKSSRETQ